MSPEEYVKLHQKAFRTAFDFLTSHFPPGTDLDWWNAKVSDLSAAGISGGDNKLVNGLLMAVYEYLEDEYKKRRNCDGKADN